MSPARRLALAAGLIVLVLGAIYTVLVDFTVCCAPPPILPGPTLPLPSPKTG